MMDAVLQLSSTVGIESACDALGISRASFYGSGPCWGRPCPFRFRRRPPVRFRRAR